MIPGLDRAVEAFHIAVSVLFVLAGAAFVGLAGWFLYAEAPLYVTLVIGGFLALWAASFAWLTWEERG